MKKEIKKPKNPVIGVKLGGKERYFRFNKKNLNLPNHGIVTSDDATQNPDIIRDLIERKSVLITEVNKSDYETYEKTKSEEVESKDPTEILANRIAALEAEVVKLRDEQVTKSVLAQSVTVQDPKVNNDNPDSELESLKNKYEELTGNKPGNKKAETLQKEIEEFNAKNK